MPQPSDEFLFTHTPVRRSILWRDVDSKDLSLWLRPNVTTVKVNVPLLKCCQVYHDQSADLIQCVEEGSNWQTHFFGGGSHAGNRRSPQSKLGAPSPSTRQPRDDTMAVDRTVLPWGTGRNRKHVTATEASVLLPAPAAASSKRCTGL